MNILIALSFFGVFIFPIFVVGYIVCENCKFNESLRKGRKYE